jgi:hypothetical protein
VAQGSYAKAMKAGFAGFALCPLGEMKLIDQDL